MSLKGSETSADPLLWNEAVYLYKQLIIEGKYRLAIMVMLGIYTGLRIGDIRSLTWDDILHTSTIQEQKSQKLKSLILPKHIQITIQDCYEYLGSPKITQKFLLSQKNLVFTIQRLNVIMKEWKEKYNLTINNISTHSLRKTMAVKLLSMFDDKIEGLKIVQGALNHTSLDATLHYLGIPQADYTKWQLTGHKICIQ